MTPYFPIPIVLSVVANSDNKANDIIYQSTPIEQLIFEKYFKQIRENLKKEKNLNGDDFKKYCKFFITITKHYPAREYQLLGFDQYNIAHFINNYLYNDGLEFLKKYEPNEKFFNKLLYIVSLKGYSIFSRPEPEVMQIRSLTTTKICGLDPNILERALLLCNLLYGYGIDAYVCIGDHHFQRYVWVMTKNDPKLSYETVPNFTMFDCGNHAYSVSSFSHHQYEFPIPTASERVDGQQKIIFSRGINPLLIGINSSKPPGEQINSLPHINDDTRNKMSPMCHWSVTGIWPDRVPCGLKVATVFNHKQIYCNIQKNDDVDVVKWDLEKPNLWAPLFTHMRNDTVYPKERSFLIKHKRTYSKEENHMILRLRRKIVFNSLKKATLKQLDKFTRRTLEYHLECKTLLKLENFYRDGSFLDSIECHLMKLRDTQLFVLLSPVQRHILNTYLKCKEKIIDLNIDSSINPENKDGEYLIKKRNKLLIQFLEGKQRKKINKSMLDLYHSILNYNSNGNLDFLYNEAMIRYFISIEKITNKIGDKLDFKYSFLSENSAAQEDCFDYLIKLKLFFIASFFNKDNPDEPAFKEIYKNNQTKEILADLANKINDDDFALVVEEMSKLDSEFQQKDDPRKTIDTYISNTTDDLMMEILLQFMESKIKPIHLDNEIHISQIKDNIQINIQIELINNYIESITNYTHKNPDQDDLPIPLNFVKKNLRCFFNHKSNFMQQILVENFEEEKNEVLALLEIILYILYNSFYDSQYVYKEKKEISNKNIELTLIEIRKLFQDLSSNRSPNTSSNNSFHLKYTAMYQSFVEFTKSLSNGNHDSNSQGSTYCSEFRKNILERTKKIITDDLKYSFSLKLRRALNILKRRPKHVIPYFEDWFIWQNEENIFHYLENLLASKNEKDFFEKFDDLLMEESKKLNFENTFRKTTFEILEIVKKSLENLKIKTDNSFTGSKNKIDNSKLLQTLNEIIKLILTEEEQIEMDIFDFNVSQYFALNYGVHQLVRPEDPISYVETAVEDIIGKLIENHLKNSKFHKNNKYFNTTKIQKKWKLIKQRIESYRLTKAIIPLCSEIKIISKPPPLLTILPNSCSKLLMTRRMMFTNITNSEFFRVSNAKNIHVKYKRIMNTLRNIKINNEAILPYIPFNSKRDGYIQFIESFDDESIQKQYKNLLNLEVAISTGSNSLLFNQKWSEKRLVMKIQKTLIEFEHSIIQTGRYKLNKLHKIVNRSIRSHRYMLRVSKHKVDDPVKIADQLSLSGAFSSSCGAEKCILVAQPFRYLLDAKSTWVVLLFIYKIPESYEQLSIYSMNNNKTIKGK
ncbi:hypothetical protein TRFO_02943 [Tritrichomonas foetus]|uniref:CEP76/DRC7 peptidase-like domain-containing protein n=1 Tax=Tritrichomonas foetus TaxID=1144522 RepID=A0A1J4L126_9EUKA|nr:hypothetical protein TRFO_02943 [Tritrichomonas foetus]|eukprot:OHT15581.1 hypothetical protein TRFO_02943 [Tritrichomonas foetus]